MSRESVYAATESWECLGRVRADFNGLTISARFILPQHASFLVGAAGSILELGHITPLCAFQHSVRNSPHCVRQHPGSDNSVTQHGVWPCRQRRLAFETDMARPSRDIVQRFVASRFHVCNRRGCMLGAHASWYPLVSRPSAQNCQTSLLIDHTFSL